MSKEADWMRSSSQSTPAGRAVHLVLITVKILSFLLLCLLGMLQAREAFCDQQAGLLSHQSVTTRVIANLPRVQAKPAKGQLLVASRRLIDPNFAETVVLILEHNQEGTLGVVINRPTEVQLSTLLPDVKELQQRTDPVYLGGPVARDQMLILARAKKPPKDALHVFEDVYTIASQNVLQQTLNKTRERAKFRAYLGYAGWAPKQLDHEVSRGDWHMVTADAATVFDKAASEIWPELIRRSEVQWTERKEPAQQKSFSFFSVLPWLATKSPFMLRVRLMVFD
jgi:putative transcriptional regulator